MTVSYKNLVRIVLFFPCFLCAAEKPAKRTLASNEVTVELRYGEISMVDVESGKKEFYRSILGMTPEVDEELLSAESKPLVTCTAKTSLQRLMTENRGMESKYLKLLKIWSLKGCQ